MTNNRPSRRGFTLAELIMAVALLAVFSVFIVQMFVKADSLARKARVLDQAVVCASNLSDQWRSGTSQDDLPEMASLMASPEAGMAETVSLDAHFQGCDPAEAFYEACLVIETCKTDVCEDTPGIWQLSIVISRAGPSEDAPIYSLKVSRYEPQGGVAP